jgi:hypothetical protein
VTSDLGGVFAGLALLGGGGGGGGRMSRSGDDGGINGDADVVSGVVLAPHVGWAAAVGIENAAGGAGSAPAGGGGGGGDGGTERVVAARSVAAGADAGEGVLAAAVDRGSRPRTGGGSSRRGEHCGATAAAVASGREAAGGGAMERKAEEAAEGEETVGGRQADAVGGALVAQPDGEEVGSVAERAAAGRVEAGEGGEAVGIGAADGGVAGGGVVRGGMAEGGGGPVVSRGGARGAAPLGRAEGIPYDATERKGSAGEDGVEVMSGGRKALGVTQRGERSGCELVQGESTMAEEDAEADDGEHIIGPLGGGETEEVAPQLDPQRVDATPEGEDGGRGAEAAEDVVGQAGRATDGRGGGGGKDEVVGGDGAEVVELAAIPQLPLREPREVIADGDAGDQAAATTAEARGPTTLSLPAATREPSVDGGRRMASRGAEGRSAVKPSSWKPQRTPDGMARGPPRAYARASRREDSEDPWHSA